MGAKAKLKPAATTTAATLPPKPDWPALQPLPSPHDLTLTSIYPNQIITVSRLFTASLSQKYVSFLKSLPLVTTPGKPKRGDAVRVNDRFQVDDPDFARRLWEETSLRSLVLEGDIDGETPNETARTTLWGGEVLGLNPNIRIYRYSEGQFFDQHYDEANKVAFPSPTDPAKSIPARTTWTLLLYLTVCEGGETVFYPDPPAGKKARNEQPPKPVATAPEVGLALLHRHGNECMLHEGKEVTKGEKWVIRSDLCVKR